MLLVENSTLSYEGFVGGLPAILRALAQVADGEIDAVGPDQQHERSARGLEHELVPDCLRAQRALDGAVVEQGEDEVDERGEH